MNVTQLFSLRAISHFQIANLLHAFPSAEQRASFNPRRLSLIRIYASILFLGILLACNLRAQISPGELSSAHANLEGISNCTQCHTVGKSLSNANCLKCHTEISSRIQQHIGFHSTIGTKECAECHQEHLGRNFSIVKLDTATFDHSKVGFRLEGKHKTIGCRQCHTPAKIIAGDVLKLSKAQKQNTYLGLSPKCASCHQDIHKGQFTQDCSSCHSSVHWKPADNFSHDRTRYPLTGKHKTVNCYSCHKAMPSDEKTIKFTHMEFSSCIFCHNDPHKGRFRQPCASCHTTKDFHRVIKTEFNHAETQFPLLGKHAFLKCAQCHEDNPKKRNISGEFGFHITKFRLCMDCHADAHAGQFANRPDKGKCESCHTVQGFSPAQFTLSDHQKTSFPLTGGHIAVPCVSCHLAGKVNAKSTRQFRWSGKITCATCHSDVHKGQFQSMMTNGCETCHSTERWQALSFSHDQTRFPLRGKHAEIACSKCHTQPTDPAKPVQYVGLPMECNSCHHDEHEGQFAVNGFTNCSRCHSAVSWQDLTFNHNTQSRFPLTGKHADVACEKCHKQVVVNKRRIVLYKPLGTQCVDCHSDRI